MIDAVHGATADVFTTMLGLEVEPLSSRMEASCPPVTDGVLSFIGLAGPWVGTGCIALSAHFACRLCAVFLMTEAEAVNEEVLDSVGELTNMIIGNFKTSAEECLGPMGISIPTVIYGRNFTSRSLGSNEWLVLPFRCGEDVFEVRICLAPASETVASRFAVEHLQTA
jgi:chemotaxis protein CheX